MVEVDDLVTRMPGWINGHSVVMIVAGMGFGTAVNRARTFPRWTGTTLIVGMILIAAAATPDRRPTAATISFFLWKRPATRGISKWLTFFVNSPEVAGLSK